MVLMHIKIFGRFVGQYIHGSMLDLELKVSGLPSLENMGLLECLVYKPHFMLNALVYNRMGGGGRGAEQEKKKNADSFCFLRPVESRGRKDER